MLCTVVTVAEPAAAPAAAPAAEPAAEPAAQCPFAPRQTLERHVRGQWQPKGPPRARRVLLQGPATRARRRTGAPRGRVPARARARGRGPWFGRWPSCGCVWSLRHNCTWDGMGMDCGHRPRYISRPGGMTRLFSSRLWCLRKMGAENLARPTDARYSPIPWHHPCDDCDSWEGPPRWGLSTRPCPS
jgi:hypothetical protein